MRDPKNTIPKGDKQDWGGIYGMEAIEKFTGLQGRIMRYMYVHFAFPLLRMPGGGWYLHKDLFYMWMLSWQRQQLTEYQNGEELVIADALKRLDMMRRDMGLLYSAEEAEMFRRIYVRVFGQDDAIEMVTGYVGNPEICRCSERCANRGPEGALAPTRSRHDEASDGS